MPFSSLDIFHCKTVALAANCHPFKQHDQPNEDNSSLPWIECWVAQLFLILLYPGYGITIQYKDRCLSERPKSGLIIFFLCFGRGTSVVRCDHRGGLAISESCRGYCRSRYDAEITQNRQ